MTNTWQLPSWKPSSCIEAPSRLQTAKLYNHGVYASVFVLLGGSMGHWLHRCQIFGNVPLAIVFIAWRIHMSGEQVSIKLITFEIPDLLDIINFFHLFKNRFALRFLSSWRYKFRKCASKYRVQRLRYKVFFKMCIHFLVIFSSFFKVGAGKIP